jgi:hypothetical protein
VRTDQKISITKWTRLLVETCLGRGFLFVVQANSTRPVWQELWNARRRFESYNHKFLSTFSPPGLLYSFNTSAISACTVQRYSILRGYDRTSSVFPPSTAGFHLLPLSNQTLLRHPEHRIPIRLRHTPNPLKCTLVLSAFGKIPLPTALRVSAHHREPIQMNTL